MVATARSPSLGFSVAALVEAAEDSGERDVTAVAAGWADEEALLDGCPQAAKHNATRRPTVAARQPIARDGAPTI